MKAIFLSLFIMFGAAQSAQALDCECKCKLAVASGETWIGNTTFNESCRGANLAIKATVTTACANFCNQQASSHGLFTNPQAACNVANKPGSWWIVPKYKLVGNAGWSKDNIETGSNKKQVSCNQTCPNGQTLKGNSCVQVPANVQGAPNKGFGEYYTWNGGLFKKMGVPQAKCPDGQWVDNGYCTRTVFSAADIQAKTGNTTGLKNADLGAGYFVWDKNLYYRGSAPQKVCPNGQWLGDNDTRCHGNATPDNVVGAPNSLVLLPWGIVDGGKVYKILGAASLVGKF